MTEIFVSHASEDGPVAQALVRLLQSALRLSDEEVFFTGAEGSGLSAGAPIDEGLRERVLGARSFVVVVSRAGLRSRYVQFEMGARWGTGKPLVPILTLGVSPGELEGPLAGIRFAELSEAGLNGVIQTLAEVLGKEASPWEEWSHLVDAALSAYEPIRDPISFAVLSYVLDRNGSFALLKHAHHKKIQPPGRRLEPHELPHAVARTVVRQQLNIAEEAFVRLPPFRGGSYGPTQIVPPPFQVQLETHPQREAEEHYDFVYVFATELVEPQLHVRKGFERRTDAAWYTLAKVRELENAPEWGPHKDMIPTMELIHSGIFQDWVRGRR